jgi:hypothetical protein
MPAGLAFQTLTIVEEPPDGWRGPVPPGPHVTLSHRSPTALPKHPLSLRVNQDLELLAMRIRQMMQAYGGVLLTVSLQERAPAAADQPTEYRFNWVTVDRPGPVPSLVLRTQRLSRPRRGKAARGFVHRRTYLWATKA